MTAVFLENSKPSMSGMGRGARGLRSTEVSCDRGDVRVSLFDL